MNLGLKLFTEYWHLVCHRRELLADGDFVKFNTPAGDVVIFNDAGEYYAFDNRCPHRGAMIYDGNHGNQSNSCQYHGWTFKGGRLIIPLVEQFKDCNIETARLNKYRLDWCGDFLFLGLEPKAELYEQLDGVAELLENISFNIDARLDFSAYDYQCYWPLAVENALEPYHIDLVHATTLATLGLEAGENTYYKTNSVWCAPVGNGRVRKQLAGLSRYFNIDYQHEGYMSIFMFPFTMLSSTFGYSYSLQNFYPSRNDASTTHFTSRLLTTHLRDENAKQVIQPFLESSAAVNRKVFDEDHAICQRMPRDSWSSDPLRFASPQEEKIDHFRSSCRNAA